MLNLEQLDKAYEMKLNGFKIREIAEAIKTNQNEISHSLNAYDMLQARYETQLQAIKDKFTCKDDEKAKLTKEWDIIKAENEKIYLTTQKQLEREAFVKLFTKNIIFKYKAKDKELHEKIEKYKQEKDEEVKSIKEENFNLIFDFQKETKEKLDVLEDFSKYKFNARFKMFFWCILGGILTLTSLIINQNFM